MKILSTEGLTKLIQLIKNSFISIDDTVTTTTVELADVATTGDYNDLTNKPTIPAAQVNADWNATSGVAQILNKPTIPTVGNGTVTLNQGGTQKGTFTLNQSGDVTIELDAGGTVDQTFDGTSQNAQSGVAIQGAGFLQNIATGTNALSILSNNANGTATTLIGADTQCSAAAHYGTAIGYHARLGAVTSAIQLGYGTNSTANSFNVGFYNNSSTHYNWQLLDGTTGLIPDARISSNIARTSDIPDVSNLANKDLSNLSTTGQAVIDGKVSKSGDTMTGALSIALSGDDTHNLIIQNDSIERFVTPSTQNQTRIQFVDKNGDDIGSIYYQQRTDGSSRLSQILRNNLGNDAYAYIGYDQNGNTYCDFPDTTCCDGQWVEKYLAVFSGVTAIGGDDYSISSYLPNDGHAYEVLACMQMNDDGVTSGTDSAAAVGNVAKPLDNNCFRIMGNSDKGIWKPRFNGVLVFLGNQRKVYYQIKARALTQGLALWFFGYRRIGTNS